MVVASARGSLCNIHEIGAEPHDSDSDSDMISDTSYTEMQGLADSGSEPEFVVPDARIDSDHEDELELELHTASNAPGCVSIYAVSGDRLASGQPHCPMVLQMMEIGSAFVPLKADRSMPLRRWTPS